MCRMAQETDLRMMAVPVTPEDLPRELEAEGGASSATSRTSKKRRPSMEMVGPRPAAPGASVCALVCIYTRHPYKSRSPSYKRASRYRYEVQRQMRGARSG